MNPLTVRIFDIETSKIVTQFLDMCTASAATAEAIYILHNAAQKSADVFSSECGCDVEEFT